MLRPKMSRRRFLGISAAATGLAVVPFGVAASTTPQLVTWRGMALGAVTTLQINHPDRRSAERLISAIIAEVRRFEAMFSLYRDDSLLSELNRSGVLLAPPPELVELLHTAHTFSEQTSGLFDITVQPLWSVYERHFSQPNADPAGPPRALVNAALAQIGYARLSISPDRIAMPRGMRLTLNGIAQGFITDKVIAMLQREGITNSLVDMGETRALGTHPNGRPWEAAIADPLTANRSSAVVPLINQAIATSAPSGFVFDAAAQFNHLFRPDTGTCATRYTSVSVIAKTATTADALSTAFCFMEPHRIKQIARANEASDVFVTDDTGANLRLLS